MLLADAVDALNWLAWAKTERARNGGAPPEPIERPGVMRAPKRPGTKVKPQPLSKIKAIYDRTDPQRMTKLDKLFR
jgi:hypothetical protein